MTPRTAIYTRVSTQEQTENFSLDMQTSKLQALAEQQGYTVARQYVDGGHSGTTRERPALTQLLADAAAGLFDVVLVYRLDRLARSTYLAYSLIQELASLNVGVKSLSEPQIDSSTPMGKVALGVTAIFAELERDTFMQRSRDGTRKAVEQGSYSGGITAYGYTTKDKRLVIHEGEAEVVRMIFGWCVERHWSNIKIADELTRLNIPTRYQLDGRGIRGKTTAHWWRAGAVLRILKNATYKGEYHYGKRNPRKGGAADSGTNGITVAACPAIVSPAIWDAAQQVLMSNRLTAMRNAKHIYMLKSLIKCEQCGSTYVGTKSDKWSGYRCGGRSNRASIPKVLGKPCTNPNLNAQTLEQPIWEHICTILRDPAHHLAEQPLTIVPAELPQVEKALAEAKVSKERLTDLYLDPKAGLDKVAYLNRLGKLDAQITSLDARLLELRDTALLVKQREQQEQELLALSAFYVDQLDNPTDELRQQLAHLFVQRVMIGAGGSVAVEWKI